MDKIQITTPGIKKALRRYTNFKSISEFIWNGFDADATTIQIFYKANAIGNIEEITIRDNGYGIAFGELQSKFKPFYQSEKEINPDKNREPSAIHGKNGVGRLTFFKFANQASWTTIYSDSNRNYIYSIDINSNQLENFSSTEPELINEETGTSVTFTQDINLLSFDFESKLLDHLILEFSWFLELNKAKNYSILINNQKLDYKPLIGESEEFNKNIDNYSFLIRFVRWKKFISEYSRYYFLDNSNNEKFKQATTLNNKGDDFYHSVYINSSLFDKRQIFNNDEANQLQKSLFPKTDDELTFEKLITYLDSYLRNKRRPYLQINAEKLVDEFEKEGLFPEYSSDPWNTFRQNELHSVVKELYQVEPKIFQKLNIEQKKTFTHFLDLIIDSGERDRLLTIIDNIVKLEPDERIQLSDILQNSSLSNVIKTIKLIEDRYKAIDELKQLVFSPTLYANERDHIQKFIEKHYWVFGEKYHLVTAAEQKFEEALRRFSYILERTNNDPKIDDPDKKKEMDIFAIRQDIQIDQINSIVVELKHPKINLGEKELAQIKKYMGVILREDRFNAPNIFWEFILVGNSFDTSGYIEGELENARNHGERSLVFKSHNYKVYVKKWSEVFSEFDMKHNYLLEKLQLQRANLSFQKQNADEVISSLEKNTAIQN